MFSGNLRNVKVPRLTRVDGFKLYEPTVAEHVQEEAASSEPEANPRHV